MIIIKNYSMPHNCYACDLHNYHECDLTTESIEEDYCWNGDSREKHCPLREVEAIPKDQYEARLTADMFAMLGMIRQDLSDKLAEEKGTYHISDVGIGLERAINTVDEYMARIEEALKGDKEE
jgi:hypothetical protein